MGCEMEHVLSVVQQLKVVTAKDSMLLLTYELDIMSKLEGFSSTIEEPDLSVAEYDRSDLSDLVGRIESYGHVDQNNGEAGKMASRGTHAFSHRPRRQASVARSRSVSPEAADS